MATNANWSDFGVLDNERIIAFVNGRLPAVFTLILIVAIAWQLARVAWMLVPASPLGDTIGTAPPAGTAGAARGQPSMAANTETIAGTHIFGAASAEDEIETPAATPTENLEETSLSLKLNGTMAGTDNRLTIAIIADNRNEEKIYSIGDTIMAGTTLHVVYTDQVVLNRNGNLEALTLPRDLPDRSAPVRRQPAVSQTTGATTNSPSIQKAVAQNATKLADIVRSTPHYADGQIRGYRVYPGRDRRQFAALGLKPGDLIKNINGASLTDRQQATQIFQNFGDANQVSVTVERNGQRQVLTLSTSQLTLENDQ